MSKVWRWSFQSFVDHCSICCWSGSGNLECSSRSSPGRDRLARPRWCGRFSRRRSYRRTTRRRTTQATGAQHSLDVGIPRPSQPDARRTPEIWGRLVESAVGAHLCNSATSAATEGFYWRDRGKEVDYVIRSGRSLVAFEVKSGTRRATPSGLAEFAKAFHPEPHAPCRYRRHPAGRFPLRTGRIVALSGAAESPATPPSRQ